MPARFLLPLLVVVGLSGFTGCALPYGGACEQIRPGQDLSSPGNVSAVPWRGGARPTGAGLLVNGSPCSCSSSEAEPCTTCFYSDLTSQYRGAPCGGNIATGGGILHCGVWSNAEGKVLGTFVHCESRT